MPLTRITSKGIADSAVTEDKITNSSVSADKLSPNSVNSGKIVDGSVAAADLASSLDLSPKSVTLSASTVQALKQPVNDNIALLGFKMAVNDGLTVFNLVDGIVDEFHDESGTDEAEGSNDVYCATSDYYHNVTVTPVSLSAGFGTASITEPDTSTVGSNPEVGAGEFGTFTVPTGMTSAAIKVFGAGAGTLNNSDYNCRRGGGGGFSSGTLAVTPGQTLKISAGEGGKSGEYPNHPFVDTEPFFQGGKSADANAPGLGFQKGGAGGGLAGVFTADHGCLSTAPQAYIIAGSGGAGGGDGLGIGGGLTGGCGRSGDAQTNSAGPGCGSGGGGDQEQGGDGGTTHSSPDVNPGPGQTGLLFKGGNAAEGTGVSGGGGAGYYGGGGGGFHPQSYGSGGGGSSYYGHPQITSGATERAGTSPDPGPVSPSNSAVNSGGAADPAYSATAGGSNTPVANMGQGHLIQEPAPTPGCHQVPGAGGDGFVLITGSYCGTANGGSSTIISNSFTATSVPTTSRIVVFEENVQTPTLNTDIIASISRDGGSNFTTATLSDSGYVTGSSGQRILTGQATISGQPSGQSMRWKLALANNTVRIHGVSLQWA